MPDEKEVIVGWRTIYQLCHDTERHVICTTERILDMKAAVSNIKFMNTRETLSSERRILKPSISSFRRSTRMCRPSKGTEKRF
jgi:hypothetical protein